MCEDITERQRAEEQLRLSQRIEAVGRLAGGIAHDFNNLLNVVTGYSEMLLKELPAGGKSHRRADHILKAAQKAADLTRQLLAFSRQQIRKPCLLDLNPLVTDMRRLLRPLIREDVEVVIRSASDLGTVRADPSQIDQVLMNLAVNAIDAMPTGGTLSIETANEELDEEFARRHPPARPGPFVMLSVSDSGEGMDAATLARVFDPFYTTKAQGRGTGLGLSTVYGIVKQSDGFVWAYSEPGRGTTFKVYLPRTTETPEQRSPGQAGPLRGGTETILLVEDQEAALDMFEEALVSHGYTVLKARDGVEGASLAAQHRGTIQLVLTDVVLPRLGGRQMADQVVQAHPEARVLFMSGYSSDAITRHGVLEPGIELIEKPFGPEALNRRVREILDRPLA
jgi:nitrogen-specific signal transduction histidine kinase